MMDSEANTLSKIVQKKSNSLGNCYRCDEKLLMFRLDKAVTDRTQKIKVQNVFMLPVGNTKDLCLGTAPELKEDLKEEGHG